MQSFTALFSNDLFWVWLKWAFLAVVWCMSALGLYRQYRLLGRINSKSAISSDILLLLRGFQERQLQLWFLVSLLMVALFTHEFHTAAPALPPVPGETEKPAQAARVKPAADPFETELSKTRKNATVPFAEIPEFNEENSSQEAYIDLLKRRYETWLVTYYYLQKCGKASPADLPVIRASLSKELAYAHAQAADESNILLAANGSYSEMYKDIPCDDAHTGPTKTAYDANMKQANTTRASSPATAAR